MKLFKAGVKMSQDNFILKGRLKGRHKLKLRALMDIDYKISEISNELEISTSRFYNVYVPMGCPHVRDNQNRIFINGLLFKDWYESIYKKRTLNKDQTFCVSCKQVVKLINPKKKQKGNLYYYLSDCPNCGKRTAKIVDQKKRGNG